MEGCEVLQRSLGAPLWSKSQASDAEDYCNGRRKMGLHNHTAITGHQMAPHPYLPRLPFERRLNHAGRTKYCNGMVRNERYQDLHANRSVSCQLQNGGSRFGKAGCPVQLVAIYLNICTSNGGFPDFAKLIWNR